jgi:hypothetical protein
MGGEAERIRVEGAARCPFCHDGLEKTAELVACAPCGARFHAACHESNQGRCPSCGATEVLVPRRPRARRREPPAGSKLEVVREDGRTVYRWDPRTPADAAVMILMAVVVITLPLALLLWLARRRIHRAELVLGEDALEFDTVNPATFRTSRVQASAQRLGAVGVNGLPGGQQYGLTLDVGLTRHKLLTGLTGMALSPPEMEWLAEEVRAWKAERQG